MSKQQKIDDLEELKESARRVIAQADEKLEEINSAPEQRSGSMPMQAPKATTKQDYATPSEVIDAVVRQYGPIVHDLAAHSKNARVASYYSIEDGCDSLAQPWAIAFPTGNLWLNPPFNNIAPWAAKCAMEARGRAGLIIMLVPASIGAEWFADHVEGKALVRPLRPRVSFDGKNPYPKDCMLLVYSREIAKQLELIAFQRKAMLKEHGVEMLHEFASWRWDKKE